MEFCPRRGIGDRAAGRRQAFLPGYTGTREGMDSELEKPASRKTMEALGGVRSKEVHSREAQCEAEDYPIDVNSTLEQYKDMYEWRIRDE